MSPRSANTAANQPGGRQAAFGFIIVSVFLDALSFGLVIPVLPRLILTLSNGDSGHAARIYGVMAAVWSLMNFAASPVLGALSDRIGRRPVLLISSFGLAADFLVTALAPTLWWLFVARALSGLTAASYSAASAYVADTTAPEQRAARFGLFSAAFGAGMIIGPAAGGLLGTLGPRAPFYAAAGLATLGWFYGLLVLPESLRPELRTRAPWHRANPIGALVILFRGRVLRGLAATAFLLQLGGQAVNVVFVLYTAYRFHWGSPQVGLLLTCYAGGNIMVMALIAPLLIRRVGEPATLLIGIGLATIGFVGLGLAPSGPLFGLACVPLCLGEVFLPALSALQTRQVGPDEQGRLQGALASLGALTGLISPVLFSQVFTWSIAPGAVLATSGTALIAAAVLIVLAFPCAVAALRQQGVDKPA